MDVSRAGSLIAAARLQAGLTQTELAERAGTTQPTISAYERGAKTPDLATLERVVAAAGFDLHMTLAPADDHDDSLERWESTLPETTRRRFKTRQAKRRAASASR